MIERRQATIGKGKPIGFKVQIEESKSKSKSDASSPPSPSRSLEKKIIREKMYKRTAACCLFD